MIEFENVGYALGATEILRDVSFTVAAGAFCVVYGRSGCGKTTLLNLARGVLLPSPGLVRVAGQLVSDRDREALARLRRRIGWIERESRFLDHISVEENVALPLLAAGVAPASRRDDLRDLLAWVGLDASGRRPPELGPAERQRAALARAVANSPDIVLADEPAAGLETREALGLVNLLVALNAMGKTVLLASQDPDLVEHVAARAPLDLVQLARGRLEPVA